MPTIPTTPAKPSSAEHPALPLQPQFRDFFNTSVLTFYSEIKCSQYTHLPFWIQWINGEKAQWDSSWLHQHFPCWSYKHLTSIQRAKLRNSGFKLNKCQYQQIQKALPSVFGYSAEQREQWFITAASTTQQLLQQEHPCVLRSQRILEHENNFGRDTWKRLSC